MSLSDSSNEKPVKQFYNRKTKRWHVFFRGTENQPLKIKKTVSEPIPGVEKCGNYGGESIAQESGGGLSSLSKQEQNDEAGDKKENDHPGFFNFI